eukprot:4416494-Pyramimonas_sp.AAC.1
MLPAARRDRPLPGLRSSPTSGMPASYLLAGHRAGASGPGTSQCRERGAFAVDDYPAPRPL